MNKKFTTFFEGIYVDSLGGVKRANGSLAAILPKELCLSCLLMPDTDRVVPKSSTIEVVWAGSQVSNNRITRCV